jgi:tryptophan halogenase
MKFIKKLAIVGGGTSGWSAAAYISNSFPHLEISLIDKEAGSPIGVGEATVLSFKPFMDACGFDYWEWLNNIDTTPKAGILYPNWIKKGNEVWHPFTTSLPIIDGMNQYTLWTHNRDLDFKRYAIASYDSAVLNNTVNVPYQAYHVDCIKLVNYFKNKLSFNNNFKHIRSGVKEIVRDSGKMKKLKLEDDREIEADLYLDCTGFMNLLTENPKRKDVYGRLFCNSAISCHVEYNDRQTEIKPYTTAYCTEVGWIWIIPNRSRIGSGIVYDKHCTTKEHAQSVLENFWKDRKISNFGYHKWDPYYKENIWEGNVVSIGLSSGFIEPLESTGLALIHLGITRLVDKIKHYYYSDSEIKRYNAEMMAAYEDAIDFVSTHYSYTERDEPFWKHVKENYKFSDRLKEIVDNHINSDFINHNFLFEDLKIFSPTNYILWLEQLGYKKKNPVKLLNNMSQSDTRKLLLDFVDCYQANSHKHFIDAPAEVELYEKYYSSSFRPDNIR